MTVVSRLLVIDRQKSYVEWDMGGLRVAHVLFYTCNYMLS